MREILIGKEGSQPFAISDPKVSRRHAILRIDPTNRKIDIIDNNSTNGTYIYNGSIFVKLFPNHPYQVTPDTMIQLGPDTRFHVRRVLAQPQPGGNGANGGKPVNPQKQPKKVDIKQLRRVSDNYTQTKMDLESKAGTINGLRSLTILVTLAAGGASGVVGNQLGLGDESKGMVWGISIAIAGVLMALLLVFINKYNRKIITRRNQNEHDYQVKYCCPECHQPFRGQVYENILAARKCPRCGAIFYDSSIDRK